MQNLSSVVNANGLNNWSPVALSSSASSAPSRFEPSFPSFAETLAAVQPPEQQAPESSSDSASMLQQLRSQSSVRSAASDSSSASQEQIDNQREDQPTVRSGGAHHSARDSRRQTTTSSASAAKRSDATKPAEAEPDDEVQLSGEAAKFAKASKSSADDSQTEASSAEEASGDEAAANQLDPSQAAASAGSQLNAKAAISTPPGNGAAPQQKTVKVSDTQALPTPGTPVGKAKPKGEPGDAQPPDASQSAVNASLDPGADAAASAVLSPASAQPNGPAAEAAGVLTEATPTPVPVLSKGKSSASSLAFALKINGANANAANSSLSSAAHKAANSNSDSPLAAAPSTPDTPFSAALNNAQSKFGDKESAESSAVTDLKAGAAAGADASAFSVANAPDSSAPTASTGAASTPAAPIVTELADDKAAATAVKNVQVQITNADNERVDLRLVERAGALTISVRSGDSNLTKALQENLPSLSNKLTDQQVRAEWWTPENPKIEATAKTNQTNNEGREQSGQSNQGGQQNSQSGQQGGRGARQQPDWMDELADSRKPNQNGTQYSWHL